MNDRITIRQAREEEAESFADIKARVYKHERDHIKLLDREKPDWYDGAWYVGLSIFNKEEALRLIQDEKCYFILKNNDVIGIFWLHSEQSDSLTLEDFCILPQFQNLGYGSVVLRLMEETFLQNRIWQLSTPVFCKRNIHLYEKCGYKKIGFVSKDTVVLFEKNLNEITGGSLT